MLLEIDISRIKNYSNTTVNKISVENLKFSEIIAPINVKKISNGFYWLKEGNDRITACLELGIRKIPARVE